MGTVQGLESAKCGLLNCDATAHIYYTSKQRFFNTKSERHRQFQEKVTISL